MAIVIKKNFLTTSDFSIILLLLVVNHPTIVSSFPLLAFSGVLLVGSDGDIKGGTWTFNLESET